MVERFFKVIHKEIDGLHEAAYLLGAFALFSKVLALLRDRLLAHNFGASEALDIYYAAFRIPDFIYISIGSLVASAVLIPFIVPKLGRDGEARDFFNGIFTLFSFATLAVSILVFIFMPGLADITTPGLSDAARSELVLLSRIMLLSPFFLGLSGLFASVTQSLRRFFVYALGPVFYNIGIIIGVLFLYPYLGLPGLAYGVVLGSLLHAVVQLPVLFREGFSPRFSLAINLTEVKNVLLLSLPRTATLSASHLVILIFVGVASFMEEGSISIFNFAFNLQSVPLSIIGISYSVAAFPTLSRLFLNGDKSAFADQVLSSLRHIIFWSFPVVALFIVLRAQIVRVILGTGEFGWPETKLTAAALALFSVSVVAQSIILLLVRGYYAAGKTVIPLVVNITSSFFIVVCAGIALNVYNTSEIFQYFMESLFRISFVSGTAVIMLPLAFSAGMLLNAYVLWWLFRREFSISRAALGATFRQSLYAAVVIGFVSYEALDIFDNVFDINTFLGIFMQGLLSGALGIAAGVLLLRLLGSEEMKEASASLHHKFWRTKPIAPDQGEL